MSHRHDVPLPSPAFDLYNYDGVEASVAGVPDRAEVRRRLQVSPLFDGMGDDELDRLSTMSSPDRFATGEFMFSVDGAASMLYTLWTGDARLEIVMEDGSSHTIATLASGDVFGLVQPPDDQSFLPRVVAETDCEVVGIDLDAAGPVIARNQAVVDALNQITTSRTRRIERALGSVEVEAADEEGQATAYARDSDDELGGS
jgi:signal-transduction protein with cAMP-binding, CBS, and nucleotidyltransferase domain